MPKTPSYRKRRGYDQAIVTLSDSATGKRRDYWLGPHGTPDSRERYHRLIAVWEAKRRRLPEPEEAGLPARGGGPPDPGESLTVAMLILEYWRWARGYYRPNERGTLRVALRLLRQHHGSEPAEAFGPRKLRALREAMIAGDMTTSPPRKPWSRKYINQQVQRIRRMFRWGASRELLPASVHQALDTVEALKRGRTAAREGRRVLPVPRERIDAALPHMNRQVRAVVELQLLTGARPGELLAMRAADIEIPPDGGGEPDLWIYRPREHKTLHRGLDRQILLGPRAQAVVRPFLAGRDPEAPLFSPAEAEAERRAAAHAARRTPLSCGNRPGSHRVAAPARTAGARYTPASYYYAVRRACDRAHPPPPPLARRAGETEATWSARLTPRQQRELAEWRRSHRWHPHQLRHNAASEIRREFGLEAAQLVLGHASAKITDAVYAERDHSRIASVVRQCG